MKNIAQHHQDVLKHHRTLVTLWCAASTRLRGEGQEAKHKAQPGFSPDPMEQNCSDLLLLSTGPVSGTRLWALCVQAVPAPGETERERECSVVLVGLLSRDSHCWVHPFSVLMAPRFVDNFIRCFTKGKNQHNKTLKYLVLIFVCGYSVHILMQNVSDQCLRTTRQCEIHVW